MVKDRKDRQHVDRKRGQMKREVNLNDISDGKLYGLNDLVKADCNDCEGCFACCQGMGTSIQLDPLDIYNLIINLDCSFEELLNVKIELNVVDGIILPNLKMDGLSEKCSFLSEEGRCKIHAFRPGICRLFPLGRYYENHSFQYFLQVHECKKQNRTKVKVRKWIDTPDLKNYESFVVDWHYFLLDVQSYITTLQDVQKIKEINMILLNQFYIKPYDKNCDFYLQFNARLDEVRNSIPTSQS